MLDDLGELRLFERILALGSLSAAAREAGLSLAVVSKRLAQLERRVQARLIHRSTRHLSPTTEGLVLREHVRRLLAEAEQAEAAIGRLRGQVAGTLRISAPNAFGRRQLVPRLARFTALHPELQVQLSLSDALVDLVGEGYDLAIRYGVLLDSRLIARPLAPNRRILCASPDYLARRGAPSTLAELAEHDCLLIGRSPVAEWRFVRDGEETAVRVRGHIVCDDGEAVHALALEGAGIARKSIWDVAEDLDAGRLLPVLPQVAIASAPLHAVYPGVGGGRQLALRVRAFVDFLAAELDQEWRRRNPDVR